MDNQIQPLGICQRIFLFIINSIGNVLKNIALVPGAPHGEVLLNDPLSNGAVYSDVKQPASIAKPIRVQRSWKDDSGSEIQVHFKQTEDEILECWTPVDKFGSSIHEATTDSPHIYPLKGQLSNVKTLDNRGKGTEDVPTVEVGGTPSGASQRGETASQGTKGWLQPATAKGKAPQETDNLAQGRRTRKTVSIMESTEKDKLKADEMRDRYPRHLISVVPNVNEKSDEFLKTRKEEMRRNYILEQKNP